MAVDSSQNFMPSGKIALDVEIMRSIEEAGGWEYTGSMNVAIAVVYDYARDRYTVYDHNQIEELQMCVAAADEIVTHNGWWFDLPVIFGVDRADWLTSKYVTTPRESDGATLYDRQIDLLRIACDLQKVDPDGPDSKTGYSDLTG